MTVRTGCGQHLSVTNAVRAAFRVRRDGGPPGIVRRLRPQGKDSCSRAPVFPTVSTRERRPWLAVTLAFLYPGLGHVYLREWRRALLWFTLALGTFILLAPSEALDTGSATGMDALRRLAGQLPILAVVSMAAVTAFSMADAYYIATADEVPTGVSCPACGREIDDDLDFCHWCTESFEEPTN